VDRESIGAEVPELSFTLFTSRWSRLIAALLVALALIAGARAATANENGLAQAQTARSSWSSIDVDAEASVERSSWS
jgi:hypothetical protein